MIKGRLKSTLRLEGCWGGNPNLRCLGRNNKYYVNLGGIQKTGDDF